jgi:hypothetical protein
MRRHVRIIVLWLLILVLPVQGIAAALRLSCDMAPHSNGQTTSEAADHCHDDDSGGMIKAPGGTPDEASTGCEHDGCQGSPHPTNSSCSACSASCLGAAAPPSIAPVLPVFEVANNAYLLTSYPFLGYIPSRLERPPRLTHSIRAL